MKRNHSKGLIIYLIIISLVLVNSFLPIVYSASNLPPGSEVTEEEVKEEKPEVEPEVEPKQTKSEKSEEDPKKEETKKEEPKEVQPEKPEEEPKEEKSEIKEEIKTEPKKEPVKEEPKVEKSKEETKPKPEEEPKEELKKEPKEEPKKEIKEETKENSDPSIKVDIKTDKTAYKPWEDIVYTITIENNGNVDLENITLKDSITDLNQKIKLLKAGQTKEIKTTYNKFSTLEEKTKKNNILISYKFDGKVTSKNKEIEAELLKPEIIKKKNSGSAFTEVDEYEEFPKDYQKYLDDLFKANISTIGMIGQARTYMNPSPGFKDTIEVDKTAEPIKGCREYQVKLEIDGEIPVKPLDIILVMDRSGSMKEGKPSSMREAKDAAIAFSKKVLKNPDNRVALVSYAYPRSVWSYGKYSDSSLNSNFTNNFGNIENKINRLNADGGTNTQAGFRRARNLMTRSSRPQVNKVIILLTDGVPTVSINNWYGPNYPESINKHSRAAISEGRASQNVARVFTVGLLNQVPSDSLGVARKVLKDSQNSGYYETFSAADLTNIYNQISEELNYAASQAKVVDKISDNFEFVEGSLSSEKATYDESTHKITWDAGNITKKTTLTYKIRAKKTFEGGKNIPTNDFAKINYIDVNDNKGTKDFPIPKVNVAAPFKVDLGEDREMMEEEIDIGENLEITSGKEPFKYEWTSSTDPEWSSDERNPIVSPDKDTTYTLNVTSENGCKASDDIKITVTRGSITISKAVTNDNSDKQFTINMSGPNGRTWSVMIKAGESQTIENLIPGKYKLEETVPANYKAVGSKNKTITISGNNINQSVGFKNRKINNTWFYDDNSINNLFKIILTE